ncbi:MAG: sensor histidine kinase, partial [Verrucomicrobiae bacterium]|nr:sensor histidine kinase [Verrucomicrobiae bacterium]
RKAIRLLAEARERREQESIRAAFARELINSQEAERGRIARELHDSLGQELLLIRNAALLESRTQNAADGPLTDIAERASRSIEEVRSIAYALRPQELDRLGFVRALETLCQEMAEPVGLAVEFSADPWPGNLSPEVEINLFRVMQEALNNVVRHAQARRLSVRVQADAAGVGICVRDDGSGFHEQTNRSQRTGLGLRSMRERVRLVGGELAVRSQPGSGTETEIRIPLAAARSGERTSTAVLS